MNVLGRWPGGTVGRWRAWPWCSARVAARPGRRIRDRARPAGFTVSATALRRAGRNADRQRAGQPAGSRRISSTPQSHGRRPGQYRRRVNVGELPDLAGCGAETRMVDRWLHYGPLLVPGRSGGSSARGRDPDGRAGIGPGVRPWLSPCTSPGRLGAPPAARQPRITGSAAGQRDRPPGRPGDRAERFGRGQVLASGWLRLARPWALRKRRRAGATGAARSARRPRQSAPAGGVQVEQGVLVGDVVAQRPAGQPVGPGRAGLADPLVPRPKYRQIRSITAGRPVTQFADAPTSLRYARSGTACPGPGRRSVPTNHTQVAQSAAVTARSSSQVPGRQRAGLLAQRQEVREHHDLAAPGAQLSALAGIVVVSGTAIPAGTGRSVTVPEISRRRTRSARAGPRPGAAPATTAPWPAPCSGLITLMRPAG